MLDTIRSFEDFREAVSTFRLPRILLTALDLKLFAVIGDRRWTVPALARRLHVSVRGLDILCRNLGSAGLLIKQGEGYRNGAVARTLLNAKHPLYRGAYLDLMKSQWEDWSRLTKAIRRGRPLESDDPNDPAYRKQFSWAMHQRALDTASEIAAQVKLQGAKTLLDLGGGPGTYALAFLARNPGLRATLCDRAPALDVGRKIARSLAQGRRLSYLPCDFMKHRIPGRYDVIWFSNVLHIYSPTENRRLFRRLLPALNPGGRLFIYDAFLLDRDGLYPPEANLFAVTMLLFTEGGNTYRADETGEWLREAGFDSVKRVRLRPGTGDWEGGLLEARAKNRSSPHRKARARRTGSAGN
jgi:SAM-dependent methyltransferase